jgi:signal transduction histidine kinase
LPSVKADRSRLQQALLNFMLNGIEAMESKGTLSITATAVERAAVEIRIADTGRGMTHEQCKRAFDPFFTTKRGGVGLGMANARKIIAAHKGQVAIHSRQGKGTTVVIVMPAMEVADNAPVERARKGTDAPKDQTGSIRRRAAARSRDRRRA